MGASHGKVDSWASRGKRIADQQASWEALEVILQQLFGDYWKGLRVGRLLEQGENLHSKPLGKPLGEPISEKQQFISDTFSGSSFDDGDNLNGRVYLVFHAIEARTREWMRTQFWRTLVGVTVS